MALYFTPYITRDKKVSDIYCKLYIKPYSVQDEEMSKDAIVLITDKHFQKLTEKPSYYKVTLNFSTFHAIKTIEKDFPLVKIFVEGMFQSQYNTFMTRYLEDYKKYCAELKIVQTLWKYKHEKKGINLQNYSFPKFELKDHQLILMALAALVRKSAILGDKGVGKTASLLHAFRYKYHRGLAKKCLVVVPNSITYKWAQGEDNEVVKHTDLNGIVVDGNKECRRDIITKFAKDPDLHFIITSYNFWSGTSKIVKDEQDNETRVCRNNDEYELLAKHAGIDMVVFDESHKLKNPNAQVVKHIKHWLKDIKNVTLMTGTLLPNQLIDVFSQYLIVDPAIYGVDYERFFYRYFTQGDKKYPEFRNEQKAIEFKKKLESIAIIYKAEECLKLPLRVYDTYKIKLSDEYCRTLLEISDEDLERMSTVTSILGDKNYMKLLQVASGFVYDENGIPVYFKNNPKIDLLEDTLDDIINEGHKSIVWYHFRADPKPLSEMMERNKIKYTMITQEDSKEDRHKKIKLFEKDSSMQAIVTSSYLTSEGVDLITARYSLWYNLTGRFDCVDQAEARNCRFGSSDLHERIFYYRFIMENSVEGLQLANLNRKMGYQEYVYGVINYIKRMKQVLLTQNKYKEART